MSIQILDGGMGRELERIGAPFKQPEWSALALMEAPEFVTQVHQNYIDAGADIITTNSYALVPFHIGQKRFDKDGRALINKAAQVARDVAGDKALVAGSIPPLFGSYNPGAYHADKALNILEPLIEEQMDHIDHFLVETLGSSEEAKLIQSHLIKTGKPFQLAFSLQDIEADLPLLHSGESLDDMVEAIDPACDALLFNCCAPEDVDTALAYIKNKVPMNLKLGGYANAFHKTKPLKTANQDLQTMRDEFTTLNYLEFARSWVKNGASIIGGCCGIGPAYIESLNKNLKNDF